MSAMHHLVPMIMLIEFVLILLAIVPTLFANPQYSIPRARPLRRTAGPTRIDRCAS